MTNPGYITNVTGPVTNLVDGVPVVIDAITNILDVTNAAGCVQLKINRQGRADIHQFHLETSGLVASNEYKLLVLLAGDTNWTQVSTFTTDDEGAANVQYKRLGHLPFVPPGLVRQALPPALDPLQAVREVAVANTNCDVVLFTDLTQPKHLHYLVKRNLTNDSVDPDAMAQLHLQANNIRTHIFVMASGLDEGGVYQLALNGSNAVSGTVDDRGRSFLRTMLPGSYPILDLTTIQLINSATNSVLGTQLP